MTPPKKNWRDRALCRAEEDSELWFPVGENAPALIQIEEAKSVCSLCSVQPDCLETAMALEGGCRPENRHGIWGGLTGRERHDLYKRRAAARARQAVTAA